MADAWANGERYESYVGRWSRAVAPRFLRWLDAEPSLRWMDVGCGTGALTGAILEHCSPHSVVGVEPSAAFASWATEHVGDHRARFVVADAAHLPDEPVDVVVAGLVVNFLPEPTVAVAAMRRATPRGTVAAYVWDYAGQMELMRHFWDAAIELDPDVSGLAEGLRFPLCNPERLVELWQTVGLTAVSTHAIDVPTVFANFDDYWQPFLGGQGPAPGYAMSLSEGRRDILRDRIRAGLPTQADGSIHLIARAWAVRGSVDSG